MSTTTAALVRGDGIGPEIIASAVEIMTAAGADIEWIDVPGGEDAFREFGAAIPEQTVDAVQQTGVALKGPMGVPMSGYTSPNQALRRAVDAYVNVRSVRHYPHNGFARYPGLDLTLVRDQTEDLTRAASQRTFSDEAGIAMKIVTRRSAERAARFSFEWAVRHGHDQVVVGHLAPTQRDTDGLFLECATQIADEFPSVELIEEALDPLAVHLLQDPSGYRLLLMQNVYGGIFCGVLAGLAGTVGVMPGGVFGPGGAVFEAGHGNAPKYVGTGRANPVGCILSGAMLLDHVGQHEAAERVRRAVHDTVIDPKVATQDLGGDGTAADFTRHCVGLLN